MLICWPGAQMGLTSQPTRERACTSQAAEKGKARNRATVVTRSRSQRLQGVSSLWAGPTLAIRFFSLDAKMLSCFQGDYLRGQG